MIYSIAGILVLIAIELLVTHMKPTARQIKDWIKLSIIFLITISLVFTTLLYTKQLSGYFDFILSLKSMSDYSAIPRDGFYLINNFLSYQSLLIITPPVLFVISIYSYLYLDKKYAAGLLCVSVISIFLMIKHLVRNIDNQILIIFFIWGVLYIKNFTNKHYSKYKYHILIFFTIVFLISTDVKVMVYRTFAAAPKLASTVNFLVNNMEINNKFKTRNFEKFVEDKRLLDYLSNKYGLIPNFYIFGDNLALYMLANIKPFFHTNIYNQSPQKEQLHTIAEILSRKVDLIIIDRNHLNFDLVPNIIRLPLLSDFLLKNYSYDSDFDNYTFLRLKKQNDLPNIKILSKIFGTDVDLKSIPLQTKPNYNADSKSEGIQYLKISFNKEYLSNHTNTTILFDVASEKFQLKFELKPYKLDYYIKLSNIWFLNYAELNNLHIKILDRNVDINFIKIDNTINSLY